MHNTQQPTETATWKCLLSHEQSMGIIKSAMLSNHSTIRHTFILDALLTGDIGEVVRLSVLTLANEQIGRSNLDIPRVPYDKPVVPESPTVEEPAPQAVSEKRNNRMEEVGIPYSLDNEDDL